ncbi:MAG: HEPN domain-containing protein [Candidatus Omnitrophica bacterium]|nr:HEPN domain-containing protein [Candidatus Omnitrophota bacterium]
MIKYEDLKLIAETRLKEATALYEADLYDGAAYICGYVVETALKARICKNLKIKEYPDDGKEKPIFSSHDFDRLLLLGGLQNRISLSNKRTKKLFENWSLLTNWRPERRYTLGGYNKQAVKDLLDALEKGQYGFFNWIKKLW